VVSPLAPQAVLGAYLSEGMTLLESLVALQGSTRSVTNALDVPTLVSLRRGRIEDLPALVELDRECFNDFWRYGAPEFEEVLATERVVVAERGEGLVGYSSALVVGSTCTIGRLAVAPTARRQRIGTALLRDAALWARKQRALGVSLCTQVGNEASRSLYRRAQLEESEERFGLAWCNAADAASNPSSTHGGA